MRAECSRGSEETAWTKEPGAGGEGLLSLKVAQGRKLGAVTESGLPDSQGPFSFFQSKLREFQRCDAVEQSCL